MILNKTTRFDFIYKIVLIFSLAFIPACSEDVLDKIPLTSYSDATVWQDASLVDAFINNVYRVFPVDWNITSCFTDEMTRRNNATYNTINEGNLTPSNTAVLNFWSNYYSSGQGGLYTGGYYCVVSRCNIFFDNIGAATFNEATRNRMIGEMKFLRAYAYFRLATIYNGVPLVTKTFKLTDDFYLSRNTYDECMAFVLKELDEAVELLPLSYDAANTGRITKGTAMAAKARALLYMASPLNNPTNDQAKWQKAADANKAVMDLGIYSLYPEYRKSYLAAAKYNSEVIWSRLYNNKLFTEFSLELSHMPPGYYGYAHVHPLQNMVDEYELTNGKLPSEDPAFDPQNPWVNRDPRFYDCILYNGAMFQGRPVECFIPGGMDSYQGPIEAWNATTTGYYVRKFIDESIVVPRGSNQGDTPFPHFRYNEILLNYAEANFYLGKEDVCREYINKIRSRPSVNMPPIPASVTGTALLEKLRHERKIELFFDGHRFFDVRRWKIAEQAFSEDGRKVDVLKNTTTGAITLEYKTFQPRNFPARMYYMPIPVEEMNKNPNLAQNPGY